MALASYFSKDLLAISQVLHSGNGEQFERILNDNIIGIALGDGVEDQEGKVVLDLIVRLLARLYPKINFIDLKKKRSRTIATLRKLALSINGNIEFSSGIPTVMIVIGNSRVEENSTAGPVFYVGSDRWVSKFSAKDPVGSSDSNIPFGAGISACIGASNIFRSVFAEFIKDNELDEEFFLSLITLDKATADLSPNITSLNIGKTQLVGAGAIGNGFLWAVANAPFIKGEIMVIEPEELQNSNLQRYVLGSEKHVGRPKIEIAKEIVLSKKIKLNTVLDDWAGYLDKTGEWKNDMVVIAVDNIADRIAIQSSLPHHLINAYTENNLLGVSRHYDFAKEACLVCTYLSGGGGDSHSQDVANNLRLGDQEVIVRDYLYYNKVVDDNLMRMVAAANRISLSELEKFKGLPMLEFYSRAVCGGILLSLRNDENVIEQIEAPLAFQSAMAGILELAEIVIQKGNLRKEKFFNTTQFYPLLPLKFGINPYNYFFTKDDSGKCICHDEDYVEAYQKKWTGS